MFEDPIRLLRQRFILLRDIVTIENAVEKDDRTFADWVESPEVL